MVRAKRASDEAYNIRRRAKRLVARLEKKGLQKEAMQLRATIAKTYVSKGHEEEARKALSQLQLQRAQMAQKVPSTSRRIAINRSNDVFLREINAMREGMPSALYPTQGLNLEARELKGQLYEKIFYQATESVWYEGKGADSAKYALENTMMAMGFDSMQDLWDYVMSTQSDAIAKVDELVDKYMNSLESGDKASLWDFLHDKMDNGRTTNSEYYQVIANLINFL